MKILKRILLVVAILVGIVLITAIFIPKKYAVERDISINKPKTEVFNYVKHLKNQDHYNKWVMKDPALKKDFRGNDGQVGFVYAWDGNKEAGQGEQEIKNISEGERIDMELRFIRPFEGRADAHMATEAISEKQTKIKWGMEGTNPYPFNIMNLFIDNILGSDLERSLVTLKSVLEQ